MTLSNMVKYSTEGAPMLISDVVSADHWSGCQYDGSGLIVEYGGRGVEKLPKEFAQTQKPYGKREKKFTSAEDAAAFESALLKAFMRLHPNAAKHPQYPNHPTYYVDSIGVFGIERRFTSPLAAVIKKLKGDVGSILFDKKNKAAALFFEMEGAGSGLIAADLSASALVVAKVVTADPKEDKALLASLEQTSLKKLKSRGQITLGNTVVVFDSAHAAADLAQLNWGSTSLQDGIAKATQSGAHGPIRVSDQKAPGGAFFGLPSGAYTYAVVRNERAGSTMYNALWLWPS